MTRLYHEIEDTVYFWFAANDTSGSGGDGATPLADVRLAGAAASAAPVLSPTPSLLTDAGYPAGCYEVAVAATAANGFAAGNTYAVFCTLTIDSQNPTGFVGSFTLEPVLANVQEWLDVAPNALVSGAVDADVSAIQNDAITAASIQANAIGSSELATGAITNAQFASSAITSGVLAAGAINSGTIAANAIGNSQLASNAITANIFNDGAIIADKVALDTVTKIRGQGPFGVSDSGTTTTIVDATAGGFGDSTTDDFYNGMMLYFRSGNLQGLGRLITDYDQASNTITVSPAFPTTITAGMTYEILPWSSVDIEWFRQAQPNALVSGAVDADVSNIQTDAINAAALAADAVNEIADGILSRDIDNVEGTMALHSLGTAVLKAISRIRDNAGTLEIYRTNGTTLHMSQTITEDVTLGPIDELTVGT
jgi:hypothetical protein